MPYKDHQAKLDNAARYRQRHPEKVRQAVAKCRDALKRDPEQYSAYIKDRNFLSRYGVTTNQVQDLILSQSGVCGLCKQPFGDQRSKRPAVDHDHTTGQIRGILHQACNMAIGHLGDNLEGASKAVAYLSSDLGAEEHW